MKVRFAIGLAAAASSACHEGALVGELMLDCRVGTTYVAGVSTLAFRIFKDNYTTGVECTNGNGMFIFTRFGIASESAPIEGAYQLECPSAGLEVRGCFRYVY